MKAFSLLFALLALSPVSAQPIHPNDPPVPVAGFTAPRYEALWTKSPFAVATSEEDTVASPDYMLVGIATIDGVSYASVIERQNQEHFLISTDKANRGLTLTSIKRGEGGADTFANVEKDGQVLTLKLEQPPAAAAVPGLGMQPGVSMNAPGTMSPQIPMPGANSGFSGGAPVRPFARIHRPPIHLPPQPAQPQPPAAQAPAPPPPSPTAPH